MVKYILFSLLLILIIPSFGFSDENEELTKVENQTLEEFTKAVNAVKEKNYEFAADIFTSQDTFDGLPLEYTVIRKYFDLHQKGLKEYSTFLFPLLTLGVWNRLIQKR